MGSPSDDRARHRHSHGAGAPQHVVFTTSLPEAYGDLDAEPLELVLDIPAPRAAGDEPTAWISPVDAPTVAIRHVVMPPPFDDDAVYEQYDEPVRHAPGARWGFVLGGAVVAVCTAYIAVAGLGALNPGSPTNSALTAPRPTTTSSAPAVPPAESAEPTPEAAPAGKAGARAGGAVAPAAAPEVAPVADPVVAAAADPVDDVVGEESTQQRVRTEDRLRGGDQTPRVATPPRTGPPTRTSPAPGTQAPPGPLPSAVTSTPPATTTTAPPPTT